MFPRTDGASFFDSTAGACSDSPRSHDFRGSPRGFNTTCVTLALPARLIVGGRRVRPRGLMLWLVVSGPAPRALVAELRSGMQTWGECVHVRMSVSSEAEFVPRLEDDSGGRWLAVVAEPDSLLRAAQALALGACGVILEGSNDSDMCQGLAALRGQRDMFLPSQLVNRMASQVHGEGAVVVAGANLTARELQVLALVARGHSNWETASRLQLSENTVRSHLRSLRAKLGVTRLQLASTAWRLGLQGDEIATSQATALERRSP